MSPFFLVTVALAGFLLGSAGPAKAQAIPVTTTSATARQAFAEGMDRVGEHNFRQAIERFQAALAEDSTFVFAILMEAWSEDALMLTRPETLALIERTSRFEHLVTDGERRLAAAFVAYYSDEVDEARILLEQLLADYPDDFAARLKLGDVYFFLLGAPDLAEEVFCAGVRIHPDRAIFRNSCGYAVLFQDRLEEAGAILRENAKRFPGHPNVHHSLAGFYLGRGRIDEAVEAYRRTLAIDPDYSSTWYDLGTALQRAGRFAEARRALEEDVRRRPSNPRSHNGLGELLLAIGEAELATSYFERALARSRDYPTARRNLMRAEILLADRELVAAVMAGDASRIAARYTGDARFEVEGSEPTKGAEAIGEKLNGIGRKGGRQLELTAEEVEPIGDGLLSHGYFLLRSPHGEPMESGQVLTIWVQDGSHLRVAYERWSTDP